jgi:hypothetical protein
MKKDSRRLDRTNRPPNIRFGSKAGMAIMLRDVHFTPKIYEYTPFCNGPDEVKSPW